jgi:hypothetical protein
MMDTVVTQLADLDAVVPHLFFGKFTKELPFAVNGTGNKMMFSQKSLLIAQLTFVSFATFHAI